LPIFQATTNPAIVKTFVVATDFFRCHRTGFPMSDQMLPSQNSSPILCSLARHHAACVEPLSATLFYEYQLVVPTLTAKPSNAPI
jgi:hypothetical protein